MLNLKWGPIAIAIALLPSTGCGSADDQSTATNLLHDYSSLQSLLAADDNHLPARERAVQDWVASCMREDGFEYVAWISLPVDEPSHESDTPNVDRFEMQLNQYNPVTDPNEAIFESLPIAEQTLYFERLWGVNELDGTNPNGNVDEVGCYNAGWVELFGPQAVQARWLVYDEAANVEQRIYADPTYITEQQNWVSCMASNGFEIENPRSLGAFLSDEFEQSTSSNRLDSADFARLRIVERDVRTANEACGSDLRLIESDLRTRIESEVLSASTLLRESVALIVEEVAAREAS
ncbi:MAG: hypothetical protein KTU85_07585 [Acidimicrobiia bacterium]|nr:hypothetical protein [Acidimicrobiia bacterium]